MQRVVEPEDMKSLRNITAAVYILQAVAFIIGISYIVAVVINYIKYDSVKGTWLESHFRWQIRTFWYSLLWSVIGIATTWMFIGFIVLIVTCIWVIYRIIRGLLVFNDAKMMYQ